MISRQTCPLVIATLALAGCTTISGLGGGSGYACKAPEGVACDSVSGTYANSVADRLPGRRSNSLAPMPQPTGLPTPRITPPASQRVADQPISAASLRSTPRVLRLWIKPWEDADGDLVDQSYVYVQVDNGQWLIEHAQRQIREAYAPVKPPPRLLNAGPGQDGAPGPQRPQPAVPARPGPLGIGPASPSAPAMSGTED